MSNLNDEKIMKMLKYFMIGVALMGVSATATAKAGAARRVSHSDKVGRCAMREWKEKNWLTTDIMAPSKRI